MVGVDDERVIKFKNLNDRYEANTLSITIGFKDCRIRSIPPFQSMLPSIAQTTRANRGVHLDHRDDDR